MTIMPTSACATPTSSTPRRPHLVVLTTGGTIVSSGDSATQMTGYSIRGVTVDALLAGVPGLDALATLSVEPVANIDSSSMTSNVWMALARRVQMFADRDDVDGIVVTHGTDTLEETAYFLSLVVRTSKPIVFTGAMRPSTATSADGPINLYNAVRVAADTTARDRGVLVMLNDTVLSARDATKTHPTNVATFRAMDAGVLGMLSGDELLWVSRTEKRHNPDVLLSVKDIDEWLNVHDTFPRVDIVVTHVDADDVMVKAALAAGAQGIVHAGSGNGSIHNGTEGALFEAAAQGTLIVRASRTGSGACVNGMAAWQEAGFIPSLTLNPQKARLLLQLVIMAAWVKGIEHHNDKVRFAVDTFHDF